MEMSLKLRKKGRDMPITLAINNLLRGMIKNTRSYTCTRINGIRMRCREKRRYLMGNKRKWKKITYY
jgi:hypothetical protein